MTFATNHSDLPSALYDQNSSGSVTVKTGSNLPKCVNLYLQVTTDKKYNSKKFLLMKSPLKVFNQLSTLSQNFAAQIMFLKIV